MANSFFSDLLASITESGRALLSRGEWRGDGRNPVGALIDLSNALLSGRGEASGTAMASEALARYAALSEADRLKFFSALVDRFGPDTARLQSAVETWRGTPSADSAQEIHYASEPRRQELFRRLNRAPGGTAALVAMRADLLAVLGDRPALHGLDRDLAHLLGSWFNRGFLVLQRIDWSSPANVLEKIIRYEAVHEIRDWNDLSRRIDPPDRRCYAFFHPALVDEPLIFVEVALTTTMPSAIAPLLEEDRMVLPQSAARTAVFYSISNCQQGLAGISFGNFLIKQVVEELRRDLPKLDTFVTLSPIPGFRSLAQARRQLLPKRPPPCWTSRAGRRVTSTPNACARWSSRLPLPTSLPPRRRPAGRSIRWRASISVMARGSSGSTGSATLREKASPKPPA